jgi:phosphatidylglycerol:prolipoprotein diacylglycerol transferase
MGIAWGFSYYYTEYLFLKNKIEATNLFKLYIGVFFSSWVGAKIFFLLFSAKEKISQYISADYFWLGGGFVFYGGLIFGLSYYFIYTLKFKKFEFSKSYLLVPGLIFGHAIGRIGCFFTGCCYGSQCSLPWAFQFNDVPRHPVQLYEAIGLIIIGAFSLKWIERKNQNEIIVKKYLIYYSFLRFAIEFFRGDTVRGVYWIHLSTSQIISILIILLVFASNRIFKGQNRFFFNI